MIVHTLNGILVNLLTIAWPTSALPESDNR